MKKTILAAFIFASCFALSTSCQKENIIEQPATLQTLTLTAEGFNTDTKTSVNGYDVSWVNGDEVKLNGTAYAITISEDHATVEADLSEATAIYGYYPADIVSADEGTTAPTVNLPNCYSSSFDGSGNQIIALPMAAYRDKGGNYVNFKHLTAAVSVTIKNETGSTLFVDAVTVSADTYRLNGSITLDLTAADYGIAPDAATDAADRTVKVSFATPLQIAVGDTKSIQVPIRPIDADNLTINVDSHNDDIPGVPVTDLTHKFNHTATSAALGRNYMLSAKVRISPLSANVVSKGTFSISDTEAIYFAKGNLQATTTDGGASWTWALATPQYNYIGAVDDPTLSTPNPTANTFVTNAEPWFDNTKNGTVDLFGWVQKNSSLSESTASGAIYGIAGATSRFTYEGNSTSNGLAHDWGETIDEGWFTLSRAQWRYLLYSRGNEGKAPTTHYDVESSGDTPARWFKAKVADVAGLVLIPDDFTWPATVTMKAGFITKDGDAFPVLNNQNGSYRYIIDAAEWSALEEAGCVFLPAAGLRDGSEVKHVPGAATQNYNAPWGYYWSATMGDSWMVYALNFTANGLSFDCGAYSYTKFGCSVRLAYPATPPAY